MSLMHQKPSEAGWFYHAPDKQPDHVEPVGVPPASQIPGLGDISVLPPEKPHEVMFRETDSKYVQLAKMGGRKDLLVVRPNSGTKKEAKGYPRCEWYYLEDNAQQAKANQSKDQEHWKFFLPEYMVYQSHGETTLPDEGHMGTGGKGDGMGLASVATQQHSPCAGNVPKSKPLTKTSRTQPHNAPAHQDEAPHLKHRPHLAEKEEPTSMTKLLAYSYQREWLDENRACEKKQTKAQKNIVPEQRRTDSRSHAVPDKSGRPQSPDENNNQVLSARKPEEDQKELFKLSKFKKVPSRLNTHRSTGVVTRKGK
ncbi:uncharacterized protein C7orf57 homolog [Babylonia areolata]|uniref:uncharacterized protein C7orf57 homolog n=1 Tax=Babylonia areolata TaxID=304850 RepID=UPI003FD3F109